MSQKSTTSIGIEYDGFGVRAARVQATGGAPHGGNSLLALEEITGSFARDEDLAAALRKIKEKLGIGYGEKIVSCCSGKQVYVAQMPFRRLSHEEMLTALRFEIRKGLPFEVSGAHLDYQIVNETDKKSDVVQIVVTAVAGIILSRQLRLLEKAGVKPDIVDVLPMAVANALSSVSPENQGDRAGAIIHIGPDISTLVFDGAAAPFYHRNIYFNAAELFGKNADPNLALRERQRRLDSFLDEINRSFAYYENTYHAPMESRIYLAGSFCDVPELCAALKARQGVPVEVVDMAEKLGSKPSGRPGVFDIVIALALRGG